MQFCDYCGSQFTGQGTTSVALGHGGTFLRECTADRWLYYCEGECSDAVERILLDISKFANLGEGSGLIWKLVDAPSPKAAPPTPKATLTAQRSKMPTADEGPTGDELRRRLKAGTRLAGIGLRPKVVSALRRADLVTVEEATKLPEHDLAAIDGVGPSAVKRIAEAMSDLGLSFAPPVYDLSATAEALRAARMAAGVSQESVRTTLRAAGFDDVVAADIGKWERGRALVPDKYRETLAALYGVADADELMIRNEEATA